MTIYRILPMHGIVIARACLYYLYFGENTAPEHLHVLKSPFEFPRNFLMKTRYHVSVESEKNFDDNDSMKRTETFLWSQIFKDTNGSIDQVHQAAGNARFASTHFANNIYMIKREQECIGRYLSVVKPISINFDCWLDFRCPTKRFSSTSKKGVLFLRTGGRCPPKVGQHNFDHLDAGETGVFIRQCFRKAIGQSIDVLNGHFNGLQNWKLHLISFMNSVIKQLPDLIQMFW